MKTLQLTEALILICTIIAVSNGSTEHASSHHDASHHGESTSQEIAEDTIVPAGIQIPEHVLSTQDVACISADNNIFQIMDEAQKVCNGTDMRCTFYHFFNHGYNRIGTLDVNKELFDDLLMKFDNWLLTAESIDKAEVNGKTHEDSPSHKASIHVNHKHKNEENADNSSVDDKIHKHHIKHPDETHHKIHQHKHENHISNHQHSYFEIFIPKDKETGKPRTVYVEVDRDKNEFVVLDEDIDKKLNGIKPIKIELDDLSQIADTAFNNIIKSAHHKGPKHNQLNYDGSILASDVNTNPSVDDHEIHLDVELDEPAQNISNSCVCNPNICNINANQQLMPDNTTGNIKKITNVSKNLVVPNKYINYAQFYIESQVDNATDIMPNTNFEILENINETDFHEIFMTHEMEPFDTIEFDQNNITDFDTDNEEHSSLDFIELPYENENGNLTENYEFSNDDKNVTYDDNDFVEITENNDISNYIDSDDAHDFSSPNTVHLIEPILQDEKPVKENKLEPTPYINAEPKLTSSLTAAISDYTSSQVDAIISENRQRNTDFNNQHPGSSLQTTQYTDNPILGKDLAKVLKTDSHLQSSFPVYATFDLPASDSQNPLSDSDFEHPKITSHNLPMDSVLGHQNTGLKIPQHTSAILPSPPVECVVRLNKGPQNSPPNLGFNRLPPYSPIEELRLPCPSSQDLITPLPVPNKDFSGSPESLSTDYFTDTSSFQSAPSFSQPYLSTMPFHLEPNMPISPKYTIMPTKLDLATPNFKRIPTITPLSVSPYSITDAINTPYPFPPCKQPTKDNYLNLKYSPIDGNFKQTMIPCAANINRYPYNTISYFLNPYLKLPQFIPQYLESLPGTPLPISLDQSYPCLSENLQRDPKPIPLTHSFAPNTPFPPLNPLLLGPGFFPNTSPNICNNIPYQSMSCLPYTILPDSRKYPHVLSNYLAPTIDLQPNQIHESFLSKNVPKSVLEQPCLAENFMQGTPSSYTPISPVYTRPVQMDLSPSSALERDLQSLSFKYGLPLSKILNTIEADISGSHSKSSSPIFEIPCSKLEHDCYLKGKSTLSGTNDVINDEKISANEDIFLESGNLTPLDSSLVGPHLEMDALLGSNNAQTYTVLSETTEPLNAQHTKVKNQPKKCLHDSSLIGPHLSTIPTNDFKLKDGNRIDNEEFHTESDSYIDSSLIGPHLNIGSHPIVLDSNISQGEIDTSHIEIPITSSSQNKVKINQNVPKNVYLDSSLNGPHLPTLYPAETLLSKHVQIINEMTPLVTDLIGLTPLESSYDGAVTKLEQLEILQHEKQADTLAAGIEREQLHESMTAKPNFIEGELLLESDSLKLMPLDSSFIGPHLQTGVLPIITNSLDDISISLTTHNSTQNTNIKDDELENIILPSSLLPTLLNKIVNADLNLNIQTQDTKLIKEVNELSLESNIELPITDIAPIKPSLKETDFQVVEPTLEVPDSIILEHQSPEIMHSKMELDSSLAGPSLDHNIEIQKIFSNLDSSIPLDSSLIGPSLLQENDSREISTILDSEDHLETYTGASNVNQDKTSLKISAAIDSKVKFDNSLTGPSLYHEMKPQEANTFDLVTHLDNSLVGSSLHEEIESSVTQSVLEDYSQLHSYLKGLKQEIETKDISHAFKSKNVLDSSLLSPHLLTAPFSSDEIKTINEEVQTKLDHTNFKPLDSSLVGPHLDFEHQLQQSEISQYQNLKADYTHLNPLDSSFVGPHLEFENQLDKSEISHYQNSESSNLVVGESPLRPTVPSISLSDLQELLSKFKKGITKSHLSEYEMKPCDKLLSSIHKISSDNQPCDDLQTITCNTLPDTTLYLQGEVFSPVTLTGPEHEFSPVHSFIEGQPCLNSNLFPSPMPFTEYAEGVPIIPISPFVQVKPHTDRNWIGPPPNIQNVLQTTPGFRPVIVENNPLPFISNDLLSITPEDFKILSDSASQSNRYSQSFNPNMYKSREAIAPSSEWQIPSNIFPVGKYIPLHPIKSSSILPSSIESTICDSEYNPNVIDNIMPLLDENSLPKSKSILPSLASTVPIFKGEIVSPSFLDTIPISNKGFIKSRPVLPCPMANKMAPSSVFTCPQIDFYNPQMIPLMTQAPKYLSPYNLQLYSNRPLEAQFSKTIGPLPKLVSLPIDYPNKYIESVANPILEKEYIQQLLSKPFLDSPINLPCTTSDSIIKLPTATNKLNGLPYQLPPVYLTPISPTLTTPSSNAYTSSILPSYVNPLSVSYAKTKSDPSTSLPLNVPYVASSFTSPSLSINPYISSPPLPEFSNPRLPVQTTLSDYANLPTEVHNRPIQSAAPYKACHTYSSPYLPVYPTSPSIESTPNPSAFMSEFTPALVSPYFPAYNHLTSVPYLRPVLKPLTNVGLPAYSDPLTSVSFSSMSPTQICPVSHSYVSADTTYSYQPLPDLIESFKLPSSGLSSAYVTPISQDSSNLPSNIRCLPNSPSNSISRPNPQITKSELQLLGPINTLPSFYVNNAISNAKQMLPTSPNKVPIQSYPAHVPKSLTLSNPQIKQNIPCEHVIQSNLKTSPLTAEVPFYNVIEENIVQDDEYYEQPSLKYPLESMSYTLAPEEMAESFPDEDFIEVEDVITSDPITSLATEPSLQTKLYHRPCLTPYSPLYGKPCPAQLFSYPQSFIETIQQNVFDNIPPMPSPRPLKFPVSQPPTFPSSVLLTSPTAVTSADNLPILPFSCIDTSVNPFDTSILQVNKNPSLYSPYYTTTGLHMSSLPTDPIVLRNMSSPAFFQVPMSSRFVSVPATNYQPISQSPTSPHISNNFGVLSPTYIDPKSNILQESLPKSSSTSSYYQYTAPMASHIRPIKQSITPQYVTPLTPAQNTKYIKPFFSPEYMSSIVPVQTTLQESIPFNKVPIHYQPYVSPTELTSTTKNIFKSPLVTSPFTVPPTLNDIVDPLSTDLNKPQWISIVTPEYSLPTSFPTIPLANKALPVTTPLTTKQVLTNHIIPSNRQVYKAQYSLPNVPILDTPNYSASNPFTKPNFEPILEVPAYPVPKNLNSPPKITPFYSILLSNLRSLDMSQGSPESYYSPITSAVPLQSSSLRKPLQKTVPQKSHQHHPQISPNYSPYVSDFPKDIFADLLPSTSSLLQSPLLIPLLPNSQNNAPLLPIDLSRLTEFPNRSPIKPLASSAGDMKYLSPSDSLISEVPEYLTPINSLPVTRYSVLKSPFHKQYQSDTIKNVPLYSNYEIQEPSLLIQTNVVNTAKPVKVSDTSASESSPMIHESSYAEMIEEIKPVSELKSRLLPLPINLSEQRQFHPEEAELIDTTEFLPLSQIKSELLVADYLPTDRTASILINTPSVEPDISQFSSYTTLLNTDLSSPSYKHLPPQYQTPRFSNQLPQPVYLSPKEYIDLIQGTSSSQASSLPTGSVLLDAKTASTNTDPQSTSSPMTIGQSSVPYYTKPISSTTKNWHQLPIFTKYLPPNEVPLEVTPENESIQSILNKYRSAYKKATLGVNNPYELMSSTSEEPLNVRNVKPIPLTKSGSNTKYEYLYSNYFNEYNNKTTSYDVESKTIVKNEIKPDNIEAKSITKTLPHIIKDFSDSNYDKIAPRPQRLSKLDHFYINNHIGKNPQVFNAPTYKTLPKGPAADVTRPYTTISPEIFKELANIHTKNYGTFPKLDITSHRLSEFYPELSNSPENVPITNSYPVNYFNPYLKHSPQIRFPSNAIEVTDTLEMPYKPIPYTPYNNIEDIKYSGYKSPKATQNLGPPTKMYDPTVVPYFTPISSVKPSNIQQIPSSSHFYRPKTIFELDNPQLQTIDISTPLHTLTPQYQATVDMTTPLQTKLDLRSSHESPELIEYDPLMSQYQTPVANLLQSKLRLNTLKEIPEYDEYNPTENVPICVENTNEENDLKTNIINYINKRENIKNYFINKNSELTIPIGNIAITKKEAHNADTIETNNPSIGLKVWKSNVKIAQAELKLKFKDLSVNNFMPVVNNLDKYDMEEIRKIVKNYIDEKYGAHIEINEPYTVDNQYAVIKDFDHNAENKYNLLWPANYV